MDPLGSFENILPWMRSFGSARSQLLYTHTSWAFTLSGEFQQVFHLADPPRQRATFVWGTGMAPLLTYLRSEWIKKLSELLVVKPELGVGISGREAEVWKSALDLSGSKVPAWKTGGTVPLARVGGRVKHDSGCA